VTSRLTCRNLETEANPENLYVRFQLQMISPTTSCTKALNSHVLWFEKAVNISLRNVSNVLQKSTDIMKKPPLYSSLRLDSKGF
jgi:hypothetical protein